MRQKRTQLLELLLERSRDREDVLVLLHDGDAPDDFPDSVKVDGTAPLVVPHLEVADILQRDRRSICTAADDQEIQLVDGLRADDTAQLIVAVGDFNHASAGFLKNALDRRDHLLERNARHGEQGRKDLDLVLLFQSADRGDFRNAGHGLQGGFDLTLVHQAQFSQVVQPLPIDERVLINPSHAAGIGSERHAGVGR